MSFIHFSSVAHFQASLSFYKERQRGELAEKEMLLKHGRKCQKLFQSEITLGNSKTMILKVPHFEETTLPLFQQGLEMSYCALFTHWRNERLSVITSDLKNDFQKSCLPPAGSDGEENFVYFDISFCYFQVLKKFENILPVFQRRYL